MLTFLASNMDQRFKGALAVEGSLEERFIALFQSQLDFFNQHPYFAVAVFSDDLLEETKKINRAINNLMQINMKYLMPIVLQGQQEDVFTKAITTEDLLYVIRVLCVY